MIETTQGIAGVASLALAYMADLLAHEDQSPEAHFLRSHLSTAANLRASLDHLIADPSPSDRPLCRLALDLVLDPMELLTTALTAAIEIDPMCGRAIAHLQAPLGGSRPTLGLLTAAFSTLAPDGNALSAILTGHAIESGLLQLSNEGAPLAERPISVPVPICLALQDQAENIRPARWPGTTLGTSEIKNVPLPASALVAAKKYALSLTGAPSQALLVRSGSLAEAKAAASEIARRLDLQPLFIDIEPGKPSPALPGLAPWLLLQQLLPVFCYELAPGERKTLPALTRYNGPRLALCGLEGGLESGTDTVPSWIIGMAPRQERAHLWQTALGSPTLAHELSSHRHGSGRIAQLGRLAHRQSRLAGRARPQLRDVLAASWTAEGVGLESLAQPLPEPVAEDALVMTPLLREELDRLLLRCRGREDLVQGLGASATTKYRPGVRALFTGPSGTGKTLAAGWLATRLALPLYRVDLAAVTSKYIGETEKNLAQLLARAEHAEVILLFDEADSIFGKRTDVKDSNDRFANAQTNYLLQRIETFDGIVFLTSNSRARFDPAFFRRLDAIIEFPVPGPAERRALWQSHLGPNHSLTPRELNQIAASADLMGGDIRKAVLTAAVQARSENHPIGRKEIIHALTDEYRKLGRQLPSELQGND